MLLHYLRDYLTAFPVLNGTELVLPCHVPALGKVKVESTRIALLLLKDNEKNPRFHETSFVYSICGDNSVITHDLVSFKPGHTLSMQNIVTKSNLNTSACNGNREPFGDNIKCADGNTVMRSYQCNLRPAAASRGLRPRFPQSNFYTFKKHRLSAGKFLHNL